MPDANPKDLLAQGKVKTLAVNGEERFRGSFLKDETPPFKDYRISIIETPAAK